MARKLAKKTTQPKKVIKKQPKKVVKPAQAVKAIQNSEVKTPQGEYVEGVGRRKVATARVRIYEAKGDFIVNDQLVGQYFANIPMAAKYFNKPFDLTGTKGKFAVTAKVSGSGIKAQLGAIVHGLARALIKYDPTFRPLLKQDGLLTRDDRMKETRKVGRGGKARRKRQSPKR